MRLYLDANSIIYSVEGLPEFRDATLEWIDRAEASGTVVTSRLARLECRVKPLRDGDAELLARFDGFFARAGLELIEVAADVLERATELRARHGFRTPDAIHLATALEANADVFLTGDRTLARCPGLDVQVLAPSS
jgi:predicted nucleic acid-binding protein